MGKRMVTDINVYHVDRLDGTIVQVWRDLESDPQVYRPTNASSDRLDRLFKGKVVDIATLSYGLSITATREQLTGEEYPARPALSDVSYW